MTRVNVRIKNRKAFERALREAPRIAEQRLQRGLDAAGATLAKNTQARDPVPFASGNLLQSFRARSSRLQHRWFPTANYAIFVERGRSPGGFPPQGAIQRWMRDKGLSGSPFPIQRSIAQRGTEAQPFMEEIVEKSDQEITNLFNRVAQQIVNDIGKRA